MKPPTTALLLIAHGSRNPEANADLDWLANELGRDGIFAPVIASFLELAAPDIAEGGRRCSAAGAKKVILVPYFLSAGVHVRRDLDAWRRKLTSLYPEMEFLLAEPLGRHPLLAEVARQRIREAGVEPADAN